MSFKEWGAVIALFGQLVVSGWLFYDRTVHPGAYETLTDVARGLLWAIGFMVVFNLLATIVMSVLVSVARRERFEDEAADERDKAIAAKSMRNAYGVLSVSAGGTLVLLAFGVEPTVGAYALFGALMLGGATEAISSLVYYRVG